MSSGATRRVTKCEPKFFRDDTLIDISAEFHEAWIEIAYGYPKPNAANHFSAFKLN